jgi:mRNA turnover protein 4
MPKSKRAKVVPLTKVKAHRREIKATLVETLRDTVGQFPRAFVFSFANLRTQPFKEMRQQLSGSARFFLGKNRVMGKALDGDDGEFRPGLAALAADLKGPVGLLCTSRTRAEILRDFAAHEAPDFARAGALADRDVVVPRGKLDLPHTMVDELRKLGMTSLRLDKGTPTLPIAFTICAAGDTLTPEQCRLLKHFGHQLSTFKLALLGEWSAAEGAYERLAGGSGGGGGRGEGAGDGDEDDEAVMEEDEDDEDEDEEEGA